MSGNMSELDPLAVALLSLGGPHRGAHSKSSHPPKDHASAPAVKRARPHKATDMQDQRPTNKYRRRGYVWRGPHREELTMHKRVQRQQDLDDAQPNNSQRQSLLSEIQEDGHTREHVQEPSHMHKQKPRVQHKDRGKEWAALTTWLRMNLHHPRTHKRVILFVGHQDTTTGTWVFSLNPVVTWLDVNLETKLRLKMLLVEAEQAYQQKYPGQPKFDWASKVQKYKTPGSDVVVDVSLWDVVNGLHSIYLQHEEPGTNNLTGEQQHLGVSTPCLAPVLQQQWQLSANAGTPPLLDGSDQPATCNGNSAANGLSHASLQHSGSEDTGHVQ